MQRTIGHKVIAGTANKYVQAKSAFRGARRRRASSDTESGKRQNGQDPRCKNKVAGRLVKEIGTTNKTWQRRMPCVLNVL
jgi:hypothetical protein